MAPSRTSPKTHPQVLPQPAALESASADTPRGRDVLCVGRMDAIVGVPARVLAAAATGRGSYQRTRTDRFGFPRLRPPRAKQVRGFATGDLVRAVVPTGKHTGTQVGRVAVRVSGRFNIRTRSGLVHGIHHRHVRLLQHSDGYGYTWEEERVPSPA